MLIVVEDRDRQIGLQPVLDLEAARGADVLQIDAAEAIAACISDDELNEVYIIPSVFNRNVAPTVAEKVIEVAQAEGLAHGGDPHDV